MKKKTAARRTRSSRTARARQGWLAVAVAAALAGIVPLAGALSAQTSGEDPALASARAAIETISNCDMNAPITGEPQPMGLFQRAIYTLWGQILTAQSQEQGIANAAVLGQVFCRQEQTFGAGLTPELLEKLHQSHVSIVSFLAAWHMNAAPASRANFLGLLRTQLETEQQLISQARAQLN